MFTWDTREERSPKLSGAAPSRRTVAATILLGIPARSSARRVF